MILMDCSQYMRNGDYIPTRLEAQQDAANLLVGAKTQSHPESTVGVSAGTELLVSPTDDVGKILSAVHAVQLSNSTEETGGAAASASAASLSDITAAVSVASLALKHRRNKNGAQRIVLFVGTPVTAETKALQKAGRQLKKNNVAIDVVALGELDANEAKLQELVDAANGRSSGGGDADAAANERTCHLVTIPAGVLPSDVLASSPVLAGGGGAFAAAAAAGGAFAGAAAGGDNTGGGGGGGGFADFGGVDPNMDPELAMALRVSMEEERARQERAAAAAAAETKDDDGGDEEGDTEMADAAAAAPAEAAAAAGLSEEDALLQQALAMSMNENDPNEDEAGGEDSKPAAAAGDEDEDVDMDEDAAMQMALQMSMAGGDDETPADAEEKKKKEDDDSKK